MKTVVLNPVYTVAMHRYGSRELTINDGYVLQRESSNPFHANAIKVLDRDSGATKAYIRRRDAHKLSYLMLNLDIVGEVLIKPKHAVEIRCQRPGPQQSCKVGFRIRDTDLENAREILKSCHIPFEIK